MRTRSRGQVSVSDMSAAGSRSTMKAVLESGRTVEFGQLPLDPDGAEPVDPFGDAGRHGADRPGVLR